MKIPYFTKTNFIGFIVLLCTLLFQGCFSTANHIVLQTTQHEKTVVPDKNIITTSFANRAYALRKISWTSSRIHINSEVVGIKDIESLLHYQLDETFLSAKLNQGEGIPLNVVINIDEYQIGERNVLLHSSDEMVANISIYDDESSLIFRASIEGRIITNSSFFLSPVHALYGYAKYKEVDSIKVMIPAISVAITKVLSGLQSGQSLDEIIMLQSIYSKSTQVIKYVEENEWGVDLLTDEEIKEHSEVIVKIEKQVKI